MNTMYIYVNISLNSSQKEKFSRQKLYRKSKHTFYVQLRFPPKIMPFMIIAENVV
jgi:hypothetical protein